MVPWISGDSGRKKKSIIFESKEKKSWFQIFRKKIVFTLEIFILVMFFMSLELSIKTVSFKKSLAKKWTFSRKKIWQYSETLFFWKKFKRNLKRDLFAYWNSCRIKFIFRRPAEILVEKTSTAQDLRFSNKRFQFLGQRLLLETQVYNSID